MSSRSSRAIQGFCLLRLHFNPHHRPSGGGASAGRFSKLASPPPPKPTFNPPPNPSNSLFRSNFTSQSNSQKLGFVNKFRPSYGLGALGRRSFSLRAPDLRNAKAVFEKPAAAVTTAFSRYREAIGLQVDAFFRRNSLFLFGVGAVFACALLWRIMFGIANTFVGLSEGMAKYGFLALSSAVVAFAGLYMRSRFTINPDKVYRMAMRKLNTSAGILEVMGAPLTGTDLRAYIMSGGGLQVKKFKPSLGNKRCFLIFPIHGSERKGLVSVEVKKKKGKYDVKLLAVDIPMASGPDQRLFLVGDENEYKVGGGLISELRDPVVKAMAASKEFENLDQIEEDEDAERELQEAEQKHREEIEKLENERELQEAEQKHREEIEKLEKDERR